MSRARAAQIGWEQPDLLVAWATMMGRRFDLYLLRRVARLPAPVLAVLLADLERRRLLRRTCEGRYELAEDGIGEAAGHHLLGRERRALPARIARVLATLVARRPCE